MVLFKWETIGIEQIWSSAVLLTNKKATVRRWVIKTGFFSRILTMKWCARFESYFITEFLAVQTFTASTIFETNVGWVWAEVSIASTYPIGRTNKKNVGVVKQDWITKKKYFLETPYILYVLRTRKKGNVYTENVET